MIKVLIADGSPAVREFLGQVLAVDPGISVIGAVGDGFEALDFVRRERPDVVVMDIDMPRMHGVEATRRIMETAPLPVVVVSGLSGPEQWTSFRAFEAGALAVVSRPGSHSDAGFEGTAKELRQVIKTMSEVRVIRRWPRERETPEKTPSPPAAPAGSPRIVGIGASTGGPDAVKTILSGLPRNFPFPIVLVQHMSHGFLEGFVDWLRWSTGHPVQLGVEGERVLPGRVYVAPESRQMGVSPDGRIVLSKRDSVDTGGPCPSISWLLRSLAESYGSTAIGILLTGMGRDGADSLKLLRDRGAVTIAQSADSCIVNGMPEAAVKLHAATHVLSPREIIAFFSRIAREPR